MTETTRPARLPDLAPGTAGVDRRRRALERAESDFVAAVVADGGIDPWRRRVEVRFRAARDALDRSGGVGVSRAESAALAVALVDRVVRGRCCQAVVDDPDHRWSPLWRHLADRALPPFRTEALFMLAWTAWCRGDLVAAQTAVGAAQREEPGHPGSILLAAVLRTGAGSAGRRGSGDRRGPPVDPVVLGHQQGLDRGKLTAQPLDELEPLPQAFRREGLAVRPDVDQSREHTVQRRGQLLVLVDVIPRWRICPRDRPSPARPRGSNRASPDKLPPRRVPAGSHGNTRRLVPAVRDDEAARVDTNDAVSELHPPPPLDPPIPDPVCRPGPPSRPCRPTR